jgi:hypothetical protein
MRLPAAAFAALALSACSITVPIAVIGSKGEVLKGTATTSSSEGSFSASDGKLSCTGRFAPAPGSLTVSFSVRCSDGRAGAGIAIRDRGGQSGSGTAQMSDGSTATFVFGDSAQGI